MYDYPLHINNRLIYKDLSKISYCLQRIRLTIRIFSLGIETTLKQIAF